MDAPIPTGLAPKLQKNRGAPNFGCPSFFTFLLFYLFYLFLHSHAGRSAEGGEDGRRHRGDDLHNPFNGFFLSHTRLNF